MHIKNHNRTAATSGISGISAIPVILTQITLVDAAQGLTRHYNCVTGDAKIKDLFLWPMLRFVMAICLRPPKTQMMMADP